MNNKTLGLLRLTDYTHQDEIRSDLGSAFEDLYESLSSAREHAREVEDVINEALYGTGCGERRSLRHKLLDPKG
jgi:hypothetical protein